MYHLDSLSEVVRLNVLNSDDVRFMFVSLPTPGNHLPQTGLCPNMSRWAESFGIHHHKPGGALFDDENIEFNEGEKENEGRGRGSQPC
jgi:hypothetical protein